MSNALPARDQSMDEILASIRRIIETGDERLARQASAVKSVAHAPERPTSGSGAAVSGRAADVAAMPGHEPAPAGDEIAEARLRAEKLLSAGEQAFNDEARAALPMSDASRVSANAPRAIRRPAPGGADAMPEWPQAIAANDRYVEAVAEMFVDEFDETGFADELLRGAVNGEAQPAAGEMQAETAEAWQDEAEDEAETQGHFAPAAAAPAHAEHAEHVAAAPLDEGIRVAHALVSRDAGERVAASFSDLAAAIRDEHLRDTDSIVREVLRPMLQEWLDENLPRLVESLVREEIERIARGGKR
ncbi:PopZ family protein [Jiella sonneratiae]|uniref:DUF2497 domain-containing protein n=1 Tax=Jiella sonneratiae TaxID=2816856 RepID=A0ABS3J7N7_9HYPH|nr:DUF2497 domain-containing protein [Jiella sonneratiae]MBO0905691.1 DUF2497 domain-containing protein [Jiella sonneratiae]